MYNINYRVNKKYIKIDLFKLTFIIYIKLKK